MPFEDPTGPPAKPRSRTTVRRRASTVPFCQSLQLATRIDVPTPAPVVGNGCGFGVLDPPQPPSSAMQQISPAARRVLRCDRRSTALTAS
jgi:hypothetical protein